MLKAFPTFRGGGLARGNRGWFQHEEPGLTSMRGLFAEGGYYVFVLADFPESFPCSSAGA